VFIVLLSACMPVIFMASKYSGLDRFLGRVSYPFYLLHFPLLTAYEYMAASYSPAALVVLVFLSSVLLLAAVEYPVDRYRLRRFTSAGVAPSAAPPVAPDPLGA
jgi:peptidoglycan/LPS O-acetylase OafA/YrhL